MPYVVTQQFEEFAHQHPAQKYAEAQNLCVVTPSYRAGVIEIQKHTITEKGPLQQCRLVDGIRAPWLLSAFDISFR